jgi:hypothetical protein
VTEFHDTRSSANDATSATAATRHTACNRDGPPPFAASAWLGGTVC